MSAANSFVERMRDSAERQSSCIVLALDYTDDEPKRLQEKALNVIKETGSSLAAVKFNFHLLLPLGFEEVKRIVEAAHQKGLQAIADIKLNDIASTNLAVGKFLWRAGFDAVIANPVVGFEEALEPVMEQAHGAGKGVIFLVYMSHKGAEEGYNLTVLDEARNQVKMHSLLLERALEWGADGVVVGATKPQAISEVAARVKGKIPIFSPGVGIQGGSPVGAVRAGTDYLIVGRAILLADNPAAATERIRRDAWTLRRGI
ncbi:MAG: orotidine 5'-phosphate decarboxylase [Thaumarchaeota archaeon]|nr:orotidine 5'-phosphate decarboxylase [Nitrososphaerota archaeon]MCL5316727.1 orotidine 5'-phosphate decarboxylase [Nitrososphaerota archaeon]